MPKNPQYTVEYRKVKHPRLEFKTGALLMILPKTGWTPEQVLEKYGGWIKRKQATINIAIQQTTQTTINKTRTGKELRNLINKKFPDHNAKENDLLTYWFLIQESQSKPPSQNSEEGKQVAGVR